MSSGEQTEAAREVALRMLTGAPRTRAQLSDGLLERGYDLEIIEGLLDRFEQVGLVDDREYAARLVRTRRDERGRSRRAIAAELARKGVARDVVLIALEEYGEDEVEVAAREARARLRRAPHGETGALRRKIFAALARKGFGSEVARTATERALREADQSDSGTQATGLAQDSPAP